MEYEKQKIQHKRKSKGISGWSQDNNYAPGTEINQSILKPFRDTNRDFWMEKKKSEQSEKRFKQQMGFENWISNKNMKS